MKYSNLLKMFVFSIGLSIISGIIIYFSYKSYEFLDYKLPKPHFVIKDSPSSYNNLNNYYKSIISLFLSTEEEGEFSLFANEFLSPHQNPEELINKIKKFNTEYNSSKIKIIENFERVFGKTIDLKKDIGINLKRHTHMKFKVNLKVINSRNREEVDFLKVYFYFDESRKFIDFEYVENLTAKNLYKTQSILEVFDKETYFKFFSKGFFQKEKSRKIISAIPQKIEVESILNVEGITYVKTKIKFSKQKYLKDGVYIFSFLKSEIIDLKKVKK